MHHDSTAGCSSNGFVMSASRGTKGEVTWSTCSRNVAQSLDKDCLRDNDGGPSEWDHMDKYDNRPGKSRGCIFARFVCPVISSCFHTPARTHFLRGLKSRVLKLPFLS